MLGDQAQRCLHIHGVIGAGGRAAAPAVVAAAAGARRRGACRSLRRCIQACGQGMHLNQDSARRGPLECVSSAFAPFRIRMRS